MSLSDSDIEEGLKKVSMAHEGYQIPSSGFKPEIEKFYDEIHTNIEDLNQKLIGLFKKKEDDLCNTYKREMTKAQKRLRELQECTSEQELNKRKIEKKEKLQKERQKFLETSIYFSNQCNEFKQTLTKVVNTTKDLESEINFLNEQIVFADRHNQKLSSELSQLKNEIHKYDSSLKLDNLEDVLALPHKFPLENNNSTFSQNNSIVNASIKQSNNNINASKAAINATQLQSNNSQLNMNGNQINNNSGLPEQSKLSLVGKYISPYGKKQVMRSNGLVDEQYFEKAKLELSKQKQINDKLTEILNDPCFQETEFERIFMDCVLTVKNKKIQPNKLPPVKGTNIQDVSNQSPIRSTESTLDFTTLSEFDFNEFHKRQILEEFLSKDEIKRYLYSIIFTNNNITNASAPIQSKQNPLSQHQRKNSQGQNSNNILDELKKN